MRIEVGHNRNQSWRQQSGSREPESAMRAVQFLPIVVLCLGLGQARRSKRAGSQQCFYPEELEGPGQGLQKLLGRASTGRFPSVSLVKLLEQRQNRAGHCPRPGTRPSSTTDLGQRSISPWEYRLDVDENRYPSKLAFAHCLCSGCIDAETGEETLGLNSVRLEQSMLVLQRRPCSRQVGRYSFELRYIKVPVGCTCAVPRSLQ